MAIDDLKEEIKKIEKDLKSKSHKEVKVIDVNDRKIHLILTSRLEKKCRKGKVWCSKDFMATVKNIKIGFDILKSRSSKGNDGIFRLDRKHNRKNKMMKKIFDGYLDKPGSGVVEIARNFHAEVEDFIPVRLVSHHMRLLGILLRREKDDYLILVDYDNTK